MLCLLWTQDNIGFRLLLTKPPVNINMKIQTMHIQCKSSEQEVALIHWHAFNIFKKTAVNEVQQVFFLPVLLWQPLSLHTSSKRLEVPAHKNETDSTNQH